jgi:hypothetical protein
VHWPQQRTDAIARQLCRVQQPYSCAECSNFLTACAAISHHVADEQCYFMERVLGNAVPAAKGMSLPPQPLLILPPPQSCTRQVTIPCRAMSSCNQGMYM